MLEAISIEEFLNDGTSLIAVFKREPVVINYVTGHSTDLIHSAISNDCLISIKAMKIIKANVPKIISSIANNKVLENIIQNINVDESPSKVSKLAEIVGICLDMFPENIHNTFKNLNQFLFVADNPDAFSLLDSILCSGKSIFMDFLSSTNFLADLIEEIKKWLFEPNADDSERIVNLYKLLLGLYNVSYFASECFKPSIIQIATDYFNHDYKNVLAMQWKLVNTILTLNPKVDFSKMYPIAISVLESVNSNQYLFEYQSEIIHFLTLFASLESVPNNIDVDKLVDVMLNIYLKFPEHSFALTEICNFMITTIEIKEFRNSIFTQFLPLIMKTFENNGRTNQSIFSKEYLRQVLDLCNSDDEFRKQYEEHNFSVIQAQDLFKNNNKILTSNYGSYVSNIPRYISI